MNSDQFREECYKHDYLILGRLHVPTEPEVILLLEVMRFHGPTTVETYLFHLEDRDMQIKHVVSESGNDPASAYEWEMDPECPRELCNFQEVLDYVSNVLVPEDTPGEAEIRYVMKKFEVDREEAIGISQQMQELRAEERICPDFGPMQMIMLLCNRAGCTISMHHDEKGHWKFEIHSKVPGQRLVTDFRIFSNVALEVIEHLNKLPKA